MIRRRRLLQASAGLLAAPALVEKVGAQSAFDWKQCKGQKIEVNLQKNPRSDVMQARQKEFEELTGISVGSEQIPEQQQRPKVAMEMATGHPSFDVVQVAMHVQKRLIERAQWMEDLRPYVANPALTAADFDIGDFSKAGMHAATGPDGKLNVLALNQDLFILMYNKQLLAAKGVAPPQTLDELMAAAVKLTDPSNGVYGFVGRGLKNANVVLYDNMLLGWDQETVTPGGKKLLTDTPAAIEAGKFYQKIMRECAPPGVVGFNWNESQTTFSQGRAAMWWDAIGFTAPLINKTQSKITDVVGFMPPPAGPKGRWSATFMDAIGIPAGSRNKQAAWLYTQWAAGKTMMNAYLGSGAGTPPRLSPYTNAEVIKGSPFKPDWFNTALECLKIARSGLPEIVPVTEFRDIIGVALTNMITGADVSDELKKATASAQIVLDKSNQT
jgi:multiple sugar transport system substrate-binding protein